MQNQELEVHFTEAEDIDQVLDNFFKDIDIDKNGILSQEEILAALGSTPEKQELLNKLQNPERDNFINNDVKGLDVKAFKKIALGNGIASGERIRWVRQNLNLDGRFARLLEVGNPLDELSGIKGMSQKQIDEVLKRFSEELARAFQSQLSRLKDPHTSGPGKLEDVRSKFSGPIGRFGDTGMFQEGLESQLGSPDPFFFKGIIREHSAGHREVTSNYRISYSGKEEYARLLGHPSEYWRNPESRELVPIYLLDSARGLHGPLKGPSEAELKELEDEFQTLQQIHNEVLEKNYGVFPGEEGHVHKSVEVEVHIPPTQAESGVAPDKLIEIKGLDGLKRILRQKSEELEAYQICITQPVEVDAAASSCGAGCNARFSVYAPLCFYTEGKDRELIAMLPSAKVLGSRVYIYGNASPADRLGKEAVIRSLLELRSERFGAAGLEQILCKQVGGGGRSAYIDSIVEEALKGTGSKIELIQARRRLGLQELMELPVVKAAGLRVEEAMQAYQYTGPLFQVHAKVSSLFSLSSHGLNVLNTGLDYRLGTACCAPCPLKGRLRGTGC